MQELFERAARGERAVLVHPQYQSDSPGEAWDEFRELVRSAGVSEAAVVRALRQKPDPALYVGRGKAEEIAEHVRQTGADLILFNCALSPVQERNLEQLCQCRVCDRTTLILDIFAQRARSHEGKLQVELAQLRHLSTRLVRGWTHLERQKGGIGLRGPGETQLETDRRLLGERVRYLRRRLDKLVRQRSQSRRARRRAAAPVVAIVGYTNAGKSTLFNALTDATCYAADQLFATLDPTVRRLAGCHSQPLLLADTVGFIRHLPHELVAAFHSTLQETREADLLLHVVDGSDPARRERIQQVATVLADIGAEDVPQLVVINKVDRLGQQAGVEYDAEGKVDRLWVSALSGDGLAQLAEVLESYFAGTVERLQLELHPIDARLRASLFEMGCVDQDQATDQGGWHMQVALSSRDRQKLDRLTDWRTRIVPEGASMRVN